MLFLERINPFSIIVSHFKTFHDEANNKPCYAERAAHVLIPALIAVAMVYSADILASKELCASLLNGFAILGGFLINAAFVITTKKDSLISGQPNAKYQRLLSETFDNTLFQILLCFAAVVLCAIFPLLNLAQENENTFILKAMSCVIFTLSIMFMITLLMILKRLNKIFE